VSVIRTPASLFVNQNASACPRIPLSHLSGAYMGSASTASRTAAFSRSVAAASSIFLPPAVT